MGFDGRIAVVSPHLDDAVLSLGAAMARASGRGATVRVVTVYAGDPAAEGPPSDWDEACGFSTADEAVRSRRQEDERACRTVGAEPVWLPFSGGASGTEIEQALEEALVPAETVLVPGFPLSHPDHASAASLAASVASGRIVGYVEQPYAMWRLLGSPPDEGRRLWNAALLGARRPPELPLPGILPLRHGLRDGRAKRRAVCAYESQLRGLGHLVLPGIELYEWGFGGEAIVER